MSTAVIRLPTPAASDLKLELFPLGDGLALQPPIVLVPGTDNPLRYTCPVTSIDAAVQWQVNQDGLTIPVFGPGLVTIADDGGIYEINQQAISADVAPVGWSQTKLNRDNANVRDEYTVSLLLDSTIATDAANVLLQVIKRADGTDLIPLSSMTKVTDGVFKFDESLNRITPGEDAIALITFTSNGTVWQHSEVIGRDSV